FPLVLCLIAANFVCSISFEQLRILIIRPDDKLFFPDKLERALQTGVERIQEAINVAPLTEHTVKTEDVLKCLQLEPSGRYSGKARMILSNNSGSVREVNLNKDIVLNYANFAILLDINQERCNKEIDLMASANPCYVRNGNRPAIARIRVCPQLDRWEVFLKSNTASDVFRHELLHALGWGTVVAPSNSIITPMDVSLNWNVGTTSQTVIRKFVDFGNSATEFARLHFNCSQLEGIETERADKMHLSEYIFGNELMTPIISTSANFFTEISARILEETHFGPERWYLVNRSIIALEGREWSYGRGWGCEFVKRSCYDYINLRLWQHRSTFPFCSTADYSKPDASLHICTPSYHRALKCGHFTMDYEERSSNGLSPHSMVNIFPGIPFQFSTRMPSGSETRFCPFIQAISSDTLFVSPRMDDIHPC
ncbi:hypothetical protein PMAYCL1PPCAC_07304, partial [Pristionchus mayeri]